MKISPCFKPSYLIVKLIYCGNSATISQRSEQKVNFYLNLYPELRVLRVSSAAINAHLSKPSLVKLTLRLTYSILRYEDE